MKNKLFYIASIFIAFMVGTTLTYIVMTKQQMDRVLKTQSNLSKHQTVKTTENPQFFDTTEKSSSNMLVNDAEMNKLTIETDAFTKNKDNLTLNDYSQEQANQLIEDMPNVVLEQYIDKFMANGTSDILADKRQFAKRAIEEIYNQNDSQLLLGEIKLSLSNSMPEVSIDTSSIDSRAKVYAHLDTRGQVPKSPYVFVKWVNNVTGQVLLFEKKDIVLNKDQNWVSFTPDEAWEVGSYDIRFYQFTSKLEPIAQMSYQINQINDVGTGMSSSGVSKISSTLLKSGLN